MVLGRVAALVSPVGKFPQTQECGEWRPLFLGNLDGFTIGGEWAPQFNWPSFSGGHLWNDCTPIKDSFYIIQDCSGSLSSRRKKSRMNYLQSIKLCPFMSSDFVFVSANWDFVYPWIVFPGAWKIWLFNYEWGFLFEPMLTKTCKVNCVFH